MRITSTAIRLVQTVLGMACAVGAIAATTEIATGPLVTATSTSVLPNLLVVMDDSGSMAWDFMPDWGSPQGADSHYYIFSTSKFGYASPQCNGVYYDPTIVYTPPVKADGSSYGNSSFTAAPMSGFESGSPTVDLGSKFTLGLSQGAAAPTSGVAAFYYVYLGSQTQPVQKKFYDANSTFYKECNTTATNLPSATITVSGSGGVTVSKSSIKVGDTELMGTAYTSGNNASTSTIAAGIAQAINQAGYDATASGSKITITGPDSAATKSLAITAPNGLTLTGSSFGAFRKVVVGANEQTNFANWFTYYRTRVNMMKSGMGLAFKPIDDHYRVGFSTINNNSPTSNGNGNMFLNIGTFNTDQKSSFYTMLYKVTPNNSTPLLRALSSAGRLYAHKLQTLNGVTATDPVQYSCQQNVTLLSTDGFWNDQDNDNLGGNPVGNTDIGQPRPYGDGGNATITKTTPTVTTTVESTPRTVTQQTTHTDNTTWNRTRTRTNNYTATTIAVSSNNGGCGNGKKKVTTTTYTGSSTETETTPVTSAQPLTTLTVTNYMDTNTSTSTDTHTVVMTNGTVSSDTTTTSVSPVVHASQVVGTPEVTNTPAGAAGVTTGTPSSSLNPALANINWTVQSGPTDSCVANGSLPTAGSTAALASSGDWSNPVDGPTSTATGTATVSSGYPITSTGATTTVTGTPTVGATTTTIANASGGMANTLSDVAMYYYSTDLRDTSLGNCAGALSGVDVCGNDVSQSAFDAASWQHMTTFTLGLGAPGKMTFSPSYLVDTDGDYASVKNGTPANPTGGVCSWGTAGQPCNWPTPNVAGVPENIDDLWHAAVNGRGTYFSATNPSSLGVGLSSALANVGSKVSASSAATVSNPNVTATDNYVFSSTFVSGLWTGQVVRQQLDPINGQVLPTIDWKAKELLDANTSRTIYTYDGANATNRRKIFAWANLSDAEKALFTQPNIATLSQFCSNGVSCLSSDAQTAASGNPLVDFIRGDRSNEGDVITTSKYYRQRASVLGDIVNSEAINVGKSLHKYADAGYGAFIATNNARDSSVYVGSNDGMLHAFDADTGAERWAYVPALVMPNLYKLADKAYNGHHQYFVDGSPAVEDAYFDSAWHTVLVGGLNAGGRGFYAIDVTSPADPKVLWEFTDPNMGLSFGNPKITKLTDGTWVVLLTSGYNNVGPGDGKGHLWVLNLKTGAIIRTMATSAGSATTPSGLARISAWGDNPNVDNTALNAYGGDLLGNVWRFDINHDNVAPMLLATLKDPAGVGQPVTTKPELGQVNGNRVVMVGTGKYLGTPDLADTQRQSFYAIKDDLGTTGVGDPRAAGSTFVHQTLSVTTCPASDVSTGLCSVGQVVRTGSSNTVDFAINKGWYIDLPDLGERDNTDPSLSNGTVGFVTNVPKSDACTAGGYSYRYYFDYRNGTPVTNAGGLVGEFLAQAISTREVNVGVNNKEYDLTSPGGKPRTDPHMGSGASSGTRRVSWRELTTDR